MAFKGAIPFDVTIEHAKQRLEAYLDQWRNAKDYTGFDALLMRTIRVVSARASTNGTSELAHCVFHLPILSGFCNPMGNMHGGAVALLADMATTMTTAPISKPGWWEFGGVSRTLQITYLRPIPRGATVRVECFLRGCGRRLSTAQCLIKDDATGQLLAMGEHGKAALEEQGRNRPKKAAQL